MKSYRDMLAEEKSRNARWTREGSFPSDKPCGGISVNGAPPACCEVHLAPWGHKRTQQEKEALAAAGYRVVPA